MDFDELETGNHHDTSKRPPALPTLPPDAELGDVIAAFNLLSDSFDKMATASRTHSVELEGIRLAVQEQGTRIETFCLRIETALGIARTRRTDPPPAEGT